MPFEKGQSGNPEGRPKGSHNKIKKDLRDKIAQFLLDNFEKVQEEFEKLEGAEKVKYYCQLLPFGLAKVKPEVEPNFERLTEEEMDEIIKILINAVYKKIEEQSREKAIPGGISYG